MEGPILVWRFYNGVMWLGLVEHLSGGYKRGID
jgi:hypothetical protein